MSVPLLDYAGILNEVYVCRLKPLRRWRIALRYESAGEKRGCLPEETSRMIIVSAQALIAQPQSLIHTGHVIIQLGRMIIPHPVMIIEPGFALIAAP
ncbi:MULTISPECIES: hypothetical protein [unclassified Sporosarcina]|uniref:hypothetical protein n=1 Tax=unclassified Sporosarcina TaxID=2647733 RepID=UPI002040C5F4|nr:MULTISPECIES: hypothetical protein [unclassified Sporosarcina]